jgi:hypothetical protein
MKLVLKCKKEYFYSQSSLTFGRRAEEKINICFDDTTSK